MRNLILVVGLMGSIVANASVNDDINKIKSRIPEAGAVKYKEVKSLQINDKVTTAVNYQVPTDHNYTVKQEVHCALSFSNPEIQQGANWGKNYLTVNSAIAIDGILYTCH